MKKMKKRYLSFLLFLTMVLGFIPQLPTTSHAASAPDVIYEPMTTEFGIFNRYNYNDLAYYTEYVKKNAFYNHTGKFGNLSPLNTYKDHENTYKWENFTMNKNGGLNIYGWLTRLNQLEIGLSATMLSNIHSHWKVIYNQKVIVFPYATIEGRYHLHTLDAQYAAEEGVHRVRLGDMEYKRLQGNDNNLTLKTKVFTLGDSCDHKGTSISNIAVTFKDAYDPFVTKAYTCDEDENAVDKVRAGETVYLKVEFSEPIRFSDNKKNHGDIRASMKDINENTIVGNLYKLKSNYLVFKFENTHVSAFDSEVITLTSVDLSDLFKEGSWVLSGLFGTGLGKGPGAEPLGFAMSKEFSGDGYTTSQCLITDIAGNPAAKPASPNLPMSSPIYIDGEAPYVSSIDKVAQMNNIGIKDDLGKDTDDGSLDDSDRFAGVGDKITYTVNFNEKLKIDGEYSDSTNFDKMLAALNVRNSGGEYVTLPSASIMQKENASVSFLPFTIEAGMTCDDPGGEIKITKITPSKASVRITDLCGNLYTDINSDNKWETLNNNPYYIDVTAPTIEFTGSHDESYSPIAVTPVSGPGTITQFYLPIKVTDDEKVNEGKSGADGIKGSFLWENGVHAQKSFNYEYAVTISQTPPDADAETWQKGITGQSYSFTQVSEGNYVHIRLIDGETYNLGSTVFTITAQDYAGNRGTKAFNLDYMADCVLPSVTLDSFDKSYDHDSKKGNIAAEVTITDDNSGLQSVYYLWVPKGSEQPSADSSGWVPAGAFDQEKESVTVNISKEIEEGQSFTGYLFIRAEEASGNISVSNLGTYTYDLSAPSYTLQYTQERQVEAELHISSLEDDCTAVVMIKVPGEADVYYVSVIESVYEEYDILNNLSFGWEDDINDINRWKTYEVTEDGGKYEFEYKEAPKGGTGTILDRILAGTYYGEIEIKLLTGRTGTESSSKFTYPPVGQDNISFGDAAFKYVVERVEGKWRTRLAEAGTNTFPVYSENINLKAAPGNAPIYKAKVTTKDDLTNKVLYSESITELSFDPDKGSPHMLSTLEGVSFNINITNEICSEWGIEDIDFSNTYLSVKRIKDQNGVDDDTVVKKLYLTPRANQTVTLPADDYPSGRYTFELIVKAKTSGKQYTFITDIDAFVDDTEASQDFGFAGYHYSFYRPSYGLDVDSFNYYGPIYEGTVDRYSASTNTIYIPVNSGVDSFSQELYFTVNDMPDSIFGVRAIKAWNVTAGVNAAESRAKSVWIPAHDATNSSMSQYNLFIAKYVDKASDVVDAYEHTGNFGYLPLVKNTLNTVAFQVVNANGKASEVRYVYIYPVDDGIPGTVSISEQSGFVTEGTLTFRPDVTRMILDLSVYVYDLNASKLIDITGNYDPYNNSYSLALTEPGPHFYYLYTADRYGNYRLYDEKFWDNTDFGAPTIVSSSCEDNSDGKFKATYVFSEDTVFYEDTQTLNLYFEDEYMKMLGFDGDSAAAGFSLKLNLKDSVNQTVFEATESNPYGIYQVDMEKVGTDSKEVKVTIYGVVKYDADVADDAEVSHKLYATLTDPFGYVSEPGAGVDIKVRNTKPKYIDGTYKKQINYSSNLRGFIAEFNTPVILDKSIATNNPSAYSQTKTRELPVFGDGNHIITFYDIFGTRWMQEIALNDVFGEDSLQVSVSETADTKDPVTLTISSDHPESTRFMVYKVKGNDQEIIAAKTASVSLDVEANSEFTIYTYTDGSKNPDTVDKLYITNIISGAPAATLQWYYSEFMSNELPDNVTETTGAVTVWYTATREVSPTGGTAASYTFYPGDTTTSYTFKYVDTAGNEGSVTAVLPIALETPPEPAPDEAPPHYQISIYGNTGEAYRPVGYYHSDTTSTITLTDVFKEVGYVQGYDLNFNVTEDSPFKIILLSGERTDMYGITYSGSTPDVVDGVALFGRSIKVTKPAIFTVAIVDEHDNISSVIMNVGDYLDNTLPTAEVNKDLNNMKHYIKLIDKSNNGHDTGSVTLLSPTGLPIVNDSSSPYHGQYYYEFTDNTTLDITFKDRAGNIGSHTITEDSIDTTAPKASVKWSPHYYADKNSGTGGEVSLPPDHLVNKDVTAIVTYDKSIDAISTYVKIDGVWELVTGKSYDDYFVMKTTSNTATVTFQKGGIDVKLVASALNGKTAESILYLGDVIDKTAPMVKWEVDYSYNKGFENGTPILAKIVLTHEKDVYCAESADPSKLIKKGESISFTVQSKGNYSYRFTDVAGNTSVLTVPVDKDIDRTPPVIKVDTGDGAATQDRVTVKISINEDATMTVTGADKKLIFQGDVSRDEQKQIEIENNGSYEVVAWDKAGNKTTSVFMVGSIDNTAPTIIFNPVTLSIRQNSGMDALETLLDNGYIVNDNVSKGDAITVTYDKADAAKINLSSPGVYTITYTVMDEAGNTATATRFVRVYSKDELDVLVNDKKTYMDGTTTTNLKTITLSVKNPLGDEPYTVYLSRGIKSEGQMKYEGTIIHLDEKDSFPVTSTGFHTLYIVTQSRQVYLTKIYIDK